MERDTFIKRHFKAYQRLDYINPNYPIHLVECILIAVNFDDYVIKLRPIISIEVEEKDFWCSIDDIEFPKKKMSILK